VAINNSPHPKSHSQTNAAASSPASSFRITSVTTVFPHRLPRSAAQLSKNDNLVCRQTHPHAFIDPRSSAFIRFHPWPLTLVTPKSHSQTNAAASSSSEQLPDHIRNNGASSSPSALCAQLSKNDNLVCRQTHPHAFIDPLSSVAIDARHPEEPQPNQRSSIIPQRAASGSHP
jgi:hypothetical protein